MSTNRFKELYEANKRAAQEQQYSSPLGQAMEQSGGNRFKALYESIKNGSVEIPLPAPSREYGSMQALLYDYNDYIGRAEKDHFGALASSKSTLQDMKDRASWYRNYYTAGRGKEDAYAADYLSALDQIDLGLKIYGSDARDLEDMISTMPSGEDKDYLSSLYDTLSTQQRYGGKFDREQYQDIEKALADAGTKYANLSNQLADYVSNLAIGDMPLDSDPGVVELREQVEAARQEYDALTKQKDDRKKPKWFADQSDKYSQITREAKAANIPKNREEAKTHSDELRDKWWGVEYQLPEGYATEEDAYQAREDIYNEEQAARQYLWAFQNNATFKYINDIDGFRDTAKENGLADGGMLAKYDFMDDDEIATYNYLYASEGRQAADDYLNYIEKFLKDQEAGRKYQEYVEYADEHPVAANVAAIPMRLISGVGEVDTKLQYVKNVITDEYEPVDFNNPAMYPALFNRAVSRTTVQKITDATGTIQLDPEKYPHLSRALNGKGWADVYQLGTSMVDSAIALGITYLTGIPGTVLLGGAAGAQGTLDALEQGATEDQALTMGLLNGAFEMLFEYVSLDKLLNGDVSKPVLKQILQQAGIEASEEMATTFANTFAADIPVMGDKSQIMQAFQEYKDAGLSDEEASRRAWEDWGVDFLWDGIGGLLSGGFMSGGNVALNKVFPDYSNYTAQYGDHSQELVAQALEQNPESKPAQRAQNTLQKGKELSGRQIHSVLQGIQTQDKAAIQTAAQNRLTELGESWGDVSKVSAALAKQAAGEKLNRAERRAIQFSHYGNQVAAELDPQTKFKDNKAPEWTGKIGTSRLNTDMYNRAVETAQTPQEAETAENIPVSQETRNPAQAVTADAVEPVSAETSYSVSDSGKTTRISTGETVRIQEVAEAGEGGMKLRTEDGALVDADDVGFASREDALLYESVADLGADAPAANALIRTYKDYPGDVSVEDYTAGAAAAFQAGMHPIPVSQLAQDPLASKLTGTQRNAAYAAGRNYGKRVATAKEESIKQGTGKTSKTSKGEGKVHFDRKGRSFSEAQETGLKTMEILSKALGTEFYVFESYEKDGKRVYLDENGKEKLAPNGFYDPNTGAVHIDLYAGSDGRGTVLFTVAHELTHFIRQWSPTKFDTLADGVMTMVYGKKNISVKEQIHAQQAKAQQAGITLTEDEAYEEMIADSMETILRDGNVLNNLMEMIQQKDATLWEKIKQWFRDLAENIRRTIDAYKDYAPDSYEGRAVASMEDYLEALEGLYADALSTAGENFQAAAKNEKSTDTRFSLREKFADELQDWFDNTTHDERKVSGKRFLVGTTTDVLRSIGVKDYNIYFGGSKIDKILENNASMSLETIKQAVMLLEDPILIMKSQTVEDSIVLFGEVYTDGNKPVMVSILLNPKTKNGEVLDYAVITSTYGRRRNNVQNLINKSIIYYVNAQKNRTDTWLKALGLQLPSAITKYGSINSIRNSEGDVKEKLSLRDTDQGDGIKYQARGYDYSKPFDQQVDDYKAGKIPKGDTLTIGATPDVFKSIGFNALPMTINTTHVDYALYGTKDADHHMGEAVLKQLPDSIKNPVAVFTSRSKSSTSVVALLPFSVNGKQAVAPVVIDGFGRNNKIVFDSNSITSTYGKTTAINQLNQAIQDEANGNFALLYINRKEAMQLLHRAGHQLSGTLIPRDGFIHSIRENASPVKPKLGNVTETQQFKRWFGDWRNHPNNASKVVNVDGTPKIMYHGTPAANGDFYVFDESKAKRRGGFGFKAFGKGNYFTSKQLDGSGRYGPRVIQAYLNIRNPFVCDGGADFLRHAAETLGLDTEKPSYDVIQNKMRTLGYDGVINRDENGEISVAVTFDSNQIKSVTDNIGTFDGSNPDIRYSLRDNIQEKSVKALKDENDRLKEDVSRLKELVKLQGKLTYGKMFSESYIENAARNLKKIADADGKTRELTDLLRGMYNEIGGGLDARFDRLEDATKPVVDWLWENKRSYLDPYAETVLDDLKGRKITISKQQAGEIFSSFDSLEAYRKRLSGTVRLVQMGTEGAMDLDSFWQEMADAYPGTFDADISDADMPGALADIVGRLQSMSFKDYEQESPEVQDAMRQELFYEVYQTFWEAKITETVADKKQKEIDQLKGEHEARMRELKAAHAETVSELKAAKETALKKLQEDTKRSQEVKKHRRNIEKKAKKLMDALVKNSDKEHIPEALKGVVGDFLNSIDFSSKSLMKKGTPTKRDISYTAALGRLQEVLQKQENLVNGVTDGNLLNDFYLDLPTGFAQEVKEHIDKVSSAVTDMDPSQNQVFSLELEDLKKLDYILTVITKSVSQINKLLANAHFQTTAEAAQTSILDFKALGKDKARGKAAGGVYRFLQWHNATPYYVFKRMGEGAQSVFEGLQDGWDRLAFNAQAIIDFTEETYTAKEVKAWTEDVKTVELSSGKKIQLTAAQLMSIYCLSQREQGKRHLFGGGIRIGDFETKQKTGKVQVSNAENYTLTIEDVAMLNGLLSDRQKVVAGKLQEYMNTVGTKWGNEVSMKRFGYQAFTEDNYFPIQSDPSNLPTMNTDSQNSSNLYRLLNLSMTKSLNKHANNAVVVGSIFDVFADHMSDMAKYNALALPVLDAMKWYNYRIQTKNESGQVTSVAVKQSMESAFGKSANSYFMNLIKDINGTNEGGKGTDKLSRKMISNYKVAAVAGNLRVALLQPTAYVRATAVLNPKYLTRGLAVNPVKAAQEAEKYSGIAAWKSMGFYDTGIARGIREQIKHDTGVKDKLVEKSMIAAEWGDRLTWGVLWNACKLEVQETKHLSGDALMEATSKRFRDVVYRTQVVDSTMTRSQSMRDTGGLSVFTTAFMAEPTLSYNMLLDAYSDYMNEARRTGDKGAAWSKAKNAVIRTLVSYTLTNLAAALAEGLMDAWRDDDEYETFLDKFLEHFGGNFRDDMNPLTKLPVVKDVLSYLDGYDNSRMDTEWLKNLTDVYNIWAETIALKTGAQEKATSVTYNGNMPLYGKLYKTLKAMSQAVGMPFSNTMREVASFWNNTVGVITGKKLRTYDPGPASQIKYAYLDGYLTQEEATQELLKLDPEGGGAKDADDAYFKIRSWETDKGQYVALDTALQQDQSIDAAVKDLTSHGIKPEEVQSHIKSTVGGWYKDNAISREEAISMLKKNTDLDSDKITAATAKWDWDIRYPEYADLREAAVSRFASSGVSAKVYYDACKFLASATGDKDANGNTISGSKKEKVMKYIASLNISDSQKDSLWNAIKGNWKGSWR